MYHISLLLLLFPSCLTTILCNAEYTLKELIARTNKAQSLWIAGENFQPDISMDYLLSLLGTKKVAKKLPKKIYKFKTLDFLPENLDSREKWPECPSIRQIRDQGNCGSCWAISSVEAMSDRLCIRSNGTLKVILSVEDAISCAAKDFGCLGGFPTDAYIFWKNNGIVTGNFYHSRKGCKPYDVAPCQHIVPTNNGRLGPLPICGTKTMPELPSCEHSCEPGYSVPYFKDKYFGDQIYSLPSEDAIKADIYFNGPVTASVEVNMDFFNYKSGIYKSTLDNSTGKHHSVKIIGWGVEDGVKYWIVANSWNTNWGDKGFLKYIRGVNQGGIESRVVAGIPLL